MRSVPALVAVALIVGFSGSVAVGAENRPSADMSVARRIGGEPRADCSSGLMLRTEPRDWARPRNLGVGPLLVQWGRSGQVYARDYGGNKFPLFLRAGHRVRVEVGPSALNARLSYVTRPQGAPRLSLEVVACPNNQTYWHGGIVADRPGCVPLRIWIDGSRRPRDVLVRLGVENCS